MCVCVCVYVCVCVLKRAHINLGDYLFYISMFLLDYREDFYNNKNSCHDLIANSRIFWSEE